MSLQKNIICVRSSNKLWKIALLICNQTPLHLTSMKMEKHGRKELQFSLKDLTHKWKKETLVLEGIITKKKRIKIGVAASVFS